MADQKTDSKTEAKPAVKPEPARPALIPAGEATDPAVQHLLAELESHRINGDKDDAQALIAYLAELGYKAG